MMENISANELGKHLDTAEVECNPFTRPRALRKLILKHVHVKPKIKFEGRGFICALITARCHVGCDHCMFASNMAEKKNAFNTMTPERVGKLMRLVADSNTGYLLVSGGGEGFLEPNLMYQIAEESTADITWLVTSAFWAKKESQALKVLENLYIAYRRGCAKMARRRVCVRVSIDSYHAEKLAENPTDPFGYILNLIRAFEARYAHQTGFFLQLHCIEGEEGLIEALRKRIDAVVVSGTSPIHAREKVTEAAVTFRMPSGYSFEITFAKLLLSDMAADLRDSDLLAKRLRLWEKDAYVNENGLTACQINADGRLGTDMLVIYDGRVAGGWQSEMPDVSINIDTDAYPSIMDKTLSDPGVLATVERGLQYRFDIIEEVCRKACIRAKAVNIRDYTSPVLLEEDAVKLYYSVRAIQGYMADGRMDASEAKNWPQELIDLVMIPKENLQALFRISGYDVIKQFEETDAGFFAFSAAIRNFARDGDADHLVEVADRYADQDRRKLDQWRLLLKRILRGWYDIHSWDERELACLDEVERLLDEQLLQRVRIYEGLSRLIPPQMSETHP
ncbi:hypothetical protein ACI2S5_21240 [Ralstonia nicotianae]|nr:MULTISPECIES: hypothetical protein [Ralstonia]ANH31485.1 hypothetical protein A3768_0302 [Ralstonia solanacearum]AGH85686.1 hypothetical protein F504_3175 [Ralstonia pseudosolanacearum FQY_4]MDO3519948.1 hypothetical protein [Ralstonia pseudosolanacearum]MDO3542547.1 hypothetical protein [Ralstonia pseudosolanacearum]UZF20715.1 hypothetical protein LG939_04320 [Ralstonia solanacearum]